MVAPLDMAVTDPERALGFSVQTLTYPEEGYELNLQSPARSRLDRTVALIVDETHRLRRRHGTTGYLHERFNGVTWETAELFGDLDEAAGSDVYRRYAGTRAAEDGESDLRE